MQVAAFPAWIIAFRKQRMLNEHSLLLVYSYGSNSLLQSQAIITERSFNGVFWCNQWRHVLNRAAGLEIAGTVFLASRVRLAFFAATRGARCAAHAEKVRLG